MKLLGFFAHHRVAANLLMVLMVLAGVWGLIKLNTQFFPNFALDFATVRVVWSGASAEDSETGITTPLEQELRNLNGLKEITSTSATGIAAITMEFHEGTDMGEALDEINERIARVRNLPTSAEDPQVSRIVRYERIGRIIITGAKHFDELRELTYRIRDDLLDRGVAKIDITGLPKQEIAIEVPGMRQQELGMSIDDIARRIRSQSQDLPAGFVGSGDVARQLRSLDQKRTIQGFRDLPLISDEQGRLITVGDVAHIERRPLNGEIQLYLHNRPAVELTLQRSETSDALQAAKIMQKWLQEARPRLPEHIELKVYDETWKLINERIMLLLRNGVGGLVLVVIILYLFLRGRIAFWVTLGIPVSFMATLGILYASGGSINMISLFGLIMALGVIVDDAIVVAENAQTNFENGEDSASAAENGAKHMFAPVTSSSLTTVAAFLPLMMVGGIIGNIMFHIPLVVICVVLASLVECMLVLPAHMRFSLTGISARHVSKRRARLDLMFNQFRDRLFEPTVRAAVKNRWVTISSAVAMLIVAVGLVRGDRIGFTFFPGIEGTMLYANAGFTAGTPRDRVQAFLEHLQETLAATEHSFKTPIIKIAVSRLGETSSGNLAVRRQGDQYGSLIVELVSPDKRKVRNAQFLAAWRERIKLPAGIETFNVVQRTAGPPGQDIDLRLTGDNAYVIKNAAAALMEKLRTYPGVSAIEDDLPWGQEQLIFHLTATGRALELSADTIGRQLRAAYDGALVQVFQDGDEEIEVRAILPEAERDRLTSLDTFQVILANGEAVPLKSVVRLTARRGFEALRHTDAHLSVRVSAEVDRNINNGNRILDDLTANYLPTLEQQYRVRYQIKGRAEDQAETMRDMRYGAMLAMVLIYIILVWVFASYSKPLVIMSAIPFGFIGAVIGHMVMGIELTILSIFGIVGLSGIVVNDSIILIAHYQHLRAKQIAVEQAIPQAACSRLRAVILTSLTTIAGLSPLLFETSLQAQFLIPMAVSITFGLAFATVLVLLVVPSILSVVESASQRVKYIKFRRLPYLN